jgi:hypothetical protein
MSGSSFDTFLLLLGIVTAAWLVISFFVMRRSRRRRPVGVLHAQPRRRDLTGEAGTFVPLSRVAPVAMQEDEEDEDEDEPEPAGPFVAHDRRPVAEPVPQELPAPAREEVGTATTYEIVWYRDETRLQFALQPVDGRGVPWSRMRSEAFAWEEDSDPPSDLRGAQRAHGRLRARLQREGWRPSGRGEGWFSHRFQPPAGPPGSA